ncbi:MAG: MOSC N-terminal beta barrel domain-containing protein, partial [Gammaproteobacteria bacterium]
MAVKGSTAERRRKTMMKVGTVRELWRYPVKGMAGERLDAVRVDGAGLAGDRRWALRDSARAEIQSCKQRPDLLRCTARGRDAESAAVEVLFPDGAVLRDDDPTMAAHLSALVGRDSTLEPLRPPSEVDFYRRYHGDGRWLEDLTATFAREPGEPLPDFIEDVPREVADFVAAPGAFFLVTPL